MSTLTPMEQLLAFCDWQRRHNPLPDGQQHVAEWAAEEIERLMALLQAVKDWDIDQALRPDVGKATLFVLPRPLRARIQAALGVTPDGDARVLTG